ncbi:hypothetical protein FS749_009116 [Ceratobasidium sp. UAMH 11750]|nr:hypothetical protein FS749_009116 [Ceratobasidium sp. UAMH 11750]
MCGRFALRNFYLNRVAEEYPNIPPRNWNDEDQFHPRYNVAPQTQVLALMQQPNGQGQQEVIVQTMRWGLQARWCDPNSFSFKNPINARSEVVLEGTAPIWNSVRGDKHCVVICEGYFEWHKRGQKRTPHYIKHPDNHLLLLAGFYELVKTTPKPTYTCTILTTEANKELAFLHDRMPVILDGKQAVRWLEAGDGKAWRGEVLEELSKPYEGKLICYEVPNGVGKVGNEDPSFVEPVAERKDGLKAMMSKMAQKPKVEKKPVPSPTRPREPIQVLSDSSDEDIKLKTQGSSPASRRTGSSPAPHQVKSSPAKMKREPPSPSKSTKREASSPVQIELLSSDSDSDDEVVVDESRKRRKMEGGSAPSTNRSRKAPNKKTIEDFFGKKRAS